VHAVRLAPRHQRLAGEAGIAAQQDTCPRPAAADLRDNTGNFLDRAGCAIGIRAAQLGRQQVPAAEDVERQVAVAVIITMEEAAFLVAMQWIIGGVQIKNDLFRGLLVGVQEEVNEQAFDRRRVMVILWYRVGSTRLSSSRFSVDLPASGAQSERCAASLPASTASTGSRRSSSWSFKSS
jgi:hypothetical protein